MLNALQSFWPQIIALSIAFGVSLAINGAITAIKHSTEPPHPVLKRWLPVLPALIGGLAGPWVWPMTLKLTFTGHPELEGVVWGDYAVVCVLLGCAQGAVSSNLYQFYTQTIMGEDGALKKPLFKFLRVDKPEGGDDEAL